MQVTPVAPAREQIAAHLQSTLVSPDATRAQVVRHVELCAEHGFNAAMIPMCWVGLARDILQGSGVKVATTICFGTGSETIAAKAALIRECVSIGVDEVDYEPNMGYWLSGMGDEFEAEAVTLVNAADGIVLKAMLELNMIPDIAGKQAAAIRLEAAGVPWIKNSSGGGPRPGHATPDDIRLLRQTLKPSTHVKASGGIKTLDQVIRLMDAGAELLGTSAAVAIVSGLENGSADY